MHQGNYNYYAHKSVCTGDFVLFINTCVEANKYILFRRQVVATAGLNSFCQKRLTQLRRPTVKKARKGTDVEIILAPLASTASPWMSLSFCCPPQPAL